MFCKSSKNSTLPFYRLQCGHQLVKIPRNSLCLLTTFCERRCSEAPSAMAMVQCLLTRRQLQRSLQSPAHSHFAQQSLRFLWCEEVIDAARRPLRATVRGSSSFHERGRGRRNPESPCCPVTGLPHVSASLVERVRPPPPLLLYHQVFVQSTCLRHLPPLEGLCVVILSSWSRPTSLPQHSPPSGF